MTKAEISDGTVHKMPADLKQALAAKPAALAVWESLTPLARNEWICWIIYNKKPETRKNHIQRAVTEMPQGKRRPCCWIGCIHRTDKPMSKSVRRALNRKSN